MRIFREASRGDAVRGETQVWTVETSSQAEAVAVWDAVKGRCLADFLHWNDGSERAGVCFTIDSVDVAVMKRVAKEVAADLKKQKIV